MPAGCSPACVRRYADLEAAPLREAVSAVEEASAGDMEGLVEGLRTGMQGCAAACEAALGRCVRLPWLSGS